MMALIPILRSFVRLMNQSRMKIPNDLDIASVWIKRFSVLYRALFASQKNMYMQTVEMLKKKRSLFVFVLLQYTQFLTTQKTKSKSYRTLIMNNFFFLTTLNNQTTSACLMFVANVIYLLLCKLLPITLMHCYLFIVTMIFKDTCLK